MRITITDAYDDGLGHWVLERIIEDDQGRQEKGVYILPRDILEWRAAEYEIDPEDAETLLDMVLAEHHLIDEEPVPLLYTAATVDEAREIHLTRCREAQSRCGLVTRGQNHALNVVREKSPRHPEAIALKKRLVAHLREQHQALRTLAQPLAMSEEERVSLLRTEVAKALGQSRRSDA